MHTNRVSAELSVGTQQKRTMHNPTFQRRSFEQHSQTNTTVDCQLHCLSCFGRGNHGTRWYYHETVKVLLQLLIFSYKIHCQFSGFHKETGLRTENIVLIENGFDSNFFHQFSSNIWVNLQSIIIKKAEFTIESKGL